MNPWTHVRCEQRSENRPDWCFLSSARTIKMWYYVVCFITLIPTFHVLHTAPVVDLESYLPDIAETIGWRDMQDIATRSRIIGTIIESCKLDHPNDSQEQTFRLLQIWVEKQGMQASTNLIQILQNMDRRGKAEKVMDIVSPPWMCRLWALFKYLRCCLYELLFWTRCLSVCTWTL